MSKNGGCRIAAGKQISLVLGPVVGVDGLRRDQPLVAVDGSADLAPAAGRSRTRLLDERCRSGHRGRSSAPSSRASARDSRSSAGTWSASRAPAPGSAGPSTRASRCRGGRPRPGWRRARPSPPWTPAGSAGRRTPRPTPRRARLRRTTRPASSARASPPSPRASSCRRRSSRATNASDRYGAASCTTCQRSHAFQSSSGTSRTAASNVSRYDGWRTTTWSKAMSGASIRRSTSPSPRTVPPPASSARVVRL